MATYMYLNMNIVDREEARRAREMKPNNNNYDYVIIITTQCACARDKVLHQEHNNMSAAKRRSHAPGSTLDLFYCRCR